MKSKINLSSYTATLVRVATVFVIAAVLAACAGILVGGAATSAVVASDRRTTGTFIEDQAIELKAIEALKSDQDVDAQTHINVTSYNQIVLVTGEAPDEELHRRVIALVSGIEKIHHVYDETKIMAPSSMVTRSGDSLVTAKVKTKLFTLKNVNATRVKIVTENGIVYLMGMVTRPESDAVAEAASQVGGVQKVVKLFEYKD